MEDPGNGEGAQPPTPAKTKTKKKRWPLHYTASFASHWPPWDKFLDPLMGAANKSVADPEICLKVGGGDDS